MSVTQGHSHHPRFHLPQPELQLLGSAYETVLTFTVLTPFQCRRPLLYVLPFALVLASMTSSLKGYDSKNMQDNAMSENSQPRAM